MATAQATGQRVEDVAQRDEFTRVYANPNGTWTSETASEPESAQDADGEWHNVDASLVAGDGALKPRYADADLRLSDGGDKVFAAMTVDGTDMEWRWPTVLPEPVVEDDTATYPGVAAGGVGDLVVTANPTGFSYDVVLHEQPSAPVDLVVPVATDGAVLSETPQGSLEVTSDSGDTLASAVPPVMYDATTDDHGDPANVVPVDTEVASPSAGTTKLTLSPDADFLADPDTVYPVTVDPSFTQYSSDTWVENADYTTSQTSSAELRAGTFDGGTHQARSFMHFDADNKWAGKKIVSANLVLRNFDSLTCSGSAIRASVITAAWGSSLTWGNQPGVSAANDTDNNDANGYSASCPGADVTWNMTPAVQAWADGTVNNGIRLAAVSPSLNSSWRRYRSSNYATVANRPHLNVTYDTYPGIPTVGADATSFVGGVGYLSKTTPTFVGLATDADGDQNKVRFEVYPTASASGTLLAWCETAYAAGTLMGCTPTAALPPATIVYMRAKSFDGLYWGGGSLGAAAGWSSWLTLKTPVQPVMTGSATVSPCSASCAGSVPETGSLTPTLSATATDADSTTLRYTFTVRDTVTLTTAASGVINQTQGVAATWTVPSGSLLRNHQYDVQVAVSDLTTPEITSSWSHFSVGASTQPTAPGPWTISPCAAPCPTSTGSVRTTASTQPTITATSTDADGDTLLYTFEVRDSVTLDPVVSGSTTMAQGQAASWTVPISNLVPGSQYDARVTVSDTIVAPVVGDWSSFLVTEQDDEADPTVTVPETPIETAAPPTFEPSGDSDAVDDLGSNPSTTAPSRGTASIVVGSWSADTATGSPVGVQGFGAGASGTGASVGIDWEPVDVPTDGGPANDFELTLGPLPGPAGQAGVVGPSSSNVAIESATRDGLAVRLNYARLADTFGGDWSDRMAVTAYPACYDTNPDDEACSQGYVVPVVNNDVDQSLTFTAPPVAAASPALTATPAGAAAAGDLGGCFPDVGEKTAQLESDDPSPVLTDDAATNTDGAVNSGLDGTEDLQSIDPTLPATPDDGSPVTLPDGNAADEDLDANNDGVEDAESGPDTVADQPFVDPSPPAPAPVTKTGYGMKADAPAACRGLVMRVAATAGSYAQPPTASTVNPSGSWQVGEGSGDFSWNYPLTMPPGIGSELPNLALSYSSASVDGMTTADNGQGSAAGLGWTMEPGYISRTYRPCFKDGEKTKGDLCWRTGTNHKLVDELSLSLAGHDTQLVHVAGGEWRLADDPGWRVQSTGTNDNHNLDFTITDTDGTQYTFGTRPVANSVWTVPVYGNNAGEPCHQTDAKASSCAQPWRWNLDSVTTADGDTIKYTYKTETNAYKRWGSTLTAYDAAGQLSNIEYGIARGGASNGTAAVNVAVSSAPRCTLKLTNPDADCDTTGSGDTTKNGPRENPRIWPDVPTDLLCSTAQTPKSCPNLSPSFFSRRRYDTITTQTTGGGTVDKYTLVQTMPDPDHKKGGDEPNLWLQKIEHTGYSGSDPTPKVTTVFKGVPLANRVAGVSGARQYRKYRVAGVRNETGGRINITYGHSDGNNCTVEKVKNLPRYQQKWECFAQQYTAPNKEPVWEWYHKYVVTRLWVGDDAVQLKGSATGQKAATTPGSAKVIDYVYDGNPAWRFDTSENIPLDDRAWNDWRGYATTEIRTRSVDENNNVVPGSQSIRRVVRYRGMANTRLNDAGLRDPNITIATTETQSPGGLIDRPRLAGRIIEETLYKGGATAEWVTRTYHAYWAVQTADDGAGHFANMVNESLTRTYTRVTATSPDTVRRNDTWREFKTVAGNPRSVLTGALLTERRDGDFETSDKVVTSNPTQLCTWTTWAASTVSWIRAPFTVAVKDGSRCDILRSKSTSYYDGAESSGSPTSISAGHITKVLAVLNTNGKTATTTSAYDIYGRVTKTTDARGLATNYIYNTLGTAPSGTQAGDALARTYSIATVSPGGAEGTTTTTSKQFGPARGLVTKSVDENGNASTYAYDGLGRITSYRSPRDNALATSNATLTYDYDISGDRPSRITTTTRRGDKTVDFLDGWGRTIETQRPGINGTGRLVSTTRYDGRGLPVITIPEKYAAGTAGSKLLNAKPSSATHYTSTEYDLMGRPVAVTQHGSNGAVYSTATTKYLGDRIVSTPARGGKTVTKLDLNGNPSSVEQYNGTTVAHSADYQYSGLGQLLSISSTIGGNLQTWSYQYDLAGRRTSATDPDTGTTTYDYYNDRPGNDAYTLVTSPGRGTTVDPTGKITLRTDYDQRGRPTKLTQVTNTTTSATPVTTLTAWAYDNATNGSGRLSKETSYNPALGTYTRTIDRYDENGNPTHVMYAAGTSGEYHTAETYTYTDNQINTVNYDAVTDPGGAGTILPQTSVKYDYTPTDAALWHIIATDPTANPATNTSYLANVEYNNDGTTRKIESANKTYLGNVTAAGAPKRLARGYRWADPIGRLSQIGFGSQALPKALTYAYDEVGNPTRVNVLSDPNDQASAVTSWCYGYDQLNRLTSAKTGTGANCVSSSTDNTFRGGPQEENLGYNYTKDRLDTVTSTGGTATYSYGVTPHQVSSITASQADPYLPPPTDLTYDAAGRVTKQVYNPANTSPSDRTTTYSYNPNGTLAKTIYPCTTDPTHNAQLDFAYDSSGARTGRQLAGCNADTSKVITLGNTEITKAGTNQATARRQYATPNGTPLAVQNAPTAGASAVTWTWLLGDQQDTIRLTKTPDTGITTVPTYLPFGGLTSTSSTSALVGERGYLNKTHDPNGEIRLDQRSYNATLNVLTTPDPLLNVGNPLSLNPYAYAGNNPIGSSDPSGLSPSDTVPGPHCFGMGCPGYESTQPKGDQVHQDAGIGLDLPNPVRLATSGASTLSSAMISLAYGGPMTPQGSAAADRSNEDSEVFGDELVKHLLFASLVIAPEDGAGLGVLKATSKGAAERVAARTAPEVASGLERTGSALSKSDPFHRSVSWAVNHPAAKQFTIKGGDGVTRDLYQLPGEVNGKAGVFEWIIDRSGSNPVINHQRFIPGGSITGYPNQVVP